MHHLFLISKKKCSILYIPKLSHSSHMKMDLEHRAYIFHQSSNTPLCKNKIQAKQVNDSRTGSWGSWTP